MADYLDYPESNPADDPFIGMAHTVAETVIAIGGPLFWSVLGIGLLTSLFR